MMKGTCGEAAWTSLKICVMTAVGYPAVSSSVAGRVSPTMAKLRLASVPPPGPNPVVPEELVELVVVLVVELVELVLEVVLEVVPPHIPPQSDPASVTHIESHWLLQQ